MIITKDDHYVILLVINNEDDIVGYCFGLTENSAIANIMGSVKRPLECNIKYGNSMISTLYYKKGEFEKYIRMCNALRMSNAKYLDNLEVIVK